MACEVDVQIQDIIRRNMIRIRNERGWTQDQLAERYGCQRSFIGQLEREHADLTWGVIAKLAEALGVEEKEFIKEKRSALEEEHVFIPLLNVRVEAGVNGIIADAPEPVDRLPFKRSWLQQKGYRDDLRIGERLCLIKARGESMEPTISDGEVLLVDGDESVRAPAGIKNGAVYIVRWGRTGDAFSVKRVHLDWDLRQIIATSDNELYRTQAIDLAEDKPLQHYIFGRVIWVGKDNI
jgi:phage repressor protein C with HTH and peptisase S24 domain